MGCWTPHSGLADACAPQCGLETFTLTIDGSPKRVKDTGELTKVAVTDAPEEKLDTPTVFLGMWDFRRAF